MEKRGPSLGGLFWTAVWLFPLLGPLETIGRTARPPAVAGTALALFCVLYVGVAWSAFDHFGPQWFRLAGLVTTGALAVALPLAYDPSWLLLILYATTACAAVFSDNPKPVLGIALLALGCVNEGMVTLSVSDDGQGPGATGPGNGLRGLDERLVAAGGALRTGSRDGGGFTLVASLPVAIAS